MGRTATPAQFQSGAKLIAVALKPRCSVSTTVPEKGSARQAELQSKCG